MAVPRLVGLERGPSSIVLVRHGESVGNLADARAREQGADRLDLPARDADVELSDEGRRQADALGAWMAQAENLPDLVVSSPYARALETARRAVTHTEREIVLDERLRELLENLCAEPDRKIVLFSEWTTMLGLIEDQLAEIGAGPRRARRRAAATASATSSAPRSP